VISLEEQIKFLTQKVRDLESYRQLYELGILKTKSGLQTENTNLTFDAENVTKMVTLEKIKSVFFHWRDT